MRIAGTTCPIDGCTRERATRNGFCEMHRARQRRNGTTEQLKPWTRRDPTAECEALECTNLATHGGYCAKHDARVRRHGDPDVVLPNVLPPVIRRAVVSYAGMHGRLRKDRGSATAHPCHDCGAPARQWSYDHLDPEGLTSAEGGYSLDPGHYLPRCVPCHKRHDLDRIHEQQQT